MEFFDLVTSEYDKRNYKFGRLENGLTLLVISDPEANYSAAAIRVDAGSFQDPEEYPGLAHFLEHLLFLGSEKFPDPNEHGLFFTNNGGFSNAWTEDQFTSYTFKIANHTRLYEALDRTASFFKDPIFDTNYIEKELCSVDSEFKKNLPDDQWRLTSVISQMVEAHSPFSKFCIGNKETLSKENVTDEVKKFWRQNYSANLIFVVVYGIDSADKIFSESSVLLEGIENKNLPFPRYRELAPSFSSKTLRKFVKFNSINDEEYLRIIWPFPPAFNSKRMSCIDYISHLFGSEHKGSIHSILHENNLVIETASSVNNTADLFTTVEIEFLLSEEGEDQIEQILKVVGSYIRMISNTGPQEMIYQELKEINNIDFRFKSKQNEYDFVSWITENYNSEEKHLLLRDGIVAPFNKEDLAEFISLLNRDNLFIIQTGKELEFTPNRREQHFGVDFEYSDISQDLYECFNSNEFDQEVKYPKSNRFISKSFDLIKEEEQLVNSYDKHEGSLVSIFHDSNFNVPKAVIFVDVSIDAKLHYSDINKYLYFKIWAEYIYHEISDICEESISASTAISLKATEKSLRFMFSGFSDSIKKSLPLTLEKIENLIPFDDENSYNSAFSGVEIEINRFFNQDPYEIGGQILTDLNYLHAFEPKDKVDALKTLSFSGFKNWYSNFYENLFFEYCFVGNISQGECKIYQSYFKKLFKSFSDYKPLDPKDHIRQDQVSPGLSEDYFHVVELDDDVHESCSLNCQFHVLVDSPYKEELANITVQAIEEDLFAMLRTEEQLGYVCSIMFSESSGYYQIEICIQGADHCPSYYHERVRAFLLKEYLKLKEMTPETFEEIKKVVLVNMNNHPLSLAESSKLYYNRIFKKRRSVKCLSELTSLLEMSISKISLSHFLDFFESCFITSPSQISLFCVNQARKEEFEEFLGKRSQPAGKRILEFKEGREVQDDLYHVTKLQHLN